MAEPEPAMITIGAGGMEGSVIGDGVLKVSVSVEVSVVGVSVVGEAMEVKVLCMSIDHYVYIDYAVHMRSCCPTL